MRFMFGLFVGAALLLTVTHLLALRPGDTLDRIRSHWPAATAGATESAALNAAADGATAEPNKRDADGAKAPPDVEDLAIAARDAVRSDPIERDPIERDPIERDPIERDPIERDPIAHDPITSDPFGLGTLPLLMDADSPDPDIASASIPSEHPTSRADTGVESVWTPFYSQLSADGFARRMTQLTAHPFSVRKDGAGRYQVVFAYADEDDRERILADLATATGSEAP